MLGAGYICCDMGKSGGLGRLVCLLLLEWWTMIKHRLNVDDFNFQINTQEMRGIVVARCFAYIQILQIRWNKKKLMVTIRY